jgi:hypothetical protein
MSRFLPFFAFLLGLAAVGWVGTGYLVNHPLALAMTVLIAAFYLAGGLELRRYRQETEALRQAVDTLRETPSQLGDWLASLPTTLQNAVRLRIEGERVGLPGPALSAYLVGLLVLLGMLGTFLGMVVTLNGTGAALASAADVQAIRASLSAPVQGLGLAFGTSIAGVAASAMLGLVSALCRRDRLQVAQRLDSRIATTLRVFTPVHRREESFRLLQQQASVLPVLVDRLAAMMTTIERQGLSLDERLASGQERFHEQARGSYEALALSVDGALKTSLIESARSAGATIQPVAEATMAGIARETAALHAIVEQGVQRQLEGFATRLQAHAADVSGLWQGALAEHRRVGEALSGDLGSTLERFATGFETRSVALVDSVAARLDASAAQVGEHWQGALARHARHSEEATAQTRDALAAAASAFEQQATALIRSVDQSQAGLRSDIAAGDQQRLAGWTTAMQAMANSLQQEWQQAGALATRQQQAMSETLAQTARDIALQTEAHARSTIAEASRLVQAAAEAPRAAAEVIAELRQKLSEGIARDNTLLEERTRLLDTLGTVLDAVHHAGTEQRGAIDALVGSSAELLDRLGSRFTDTLDTQTSKMDAVASQVTGSAAEVASLGEAFGLAVQLFSQSTEKLGAQLQRIEGALGKSTARSDEQLAYYVAQAREVIDLSIMSQKQIVEDLRQLADRREPVGSEA